MKGNCLSPVVLDLWPALEIRFRPLGPSLRIPGIQGERTCVRPSRRLTKSQRQRGRKKKKKIPEAHYGTNNPSHLRGDGRASWTDSQPVDLWKRPEVRLRGEGPPITHGWKHHKAASDCQEKYHKRKKQLRRERKKFLPKEAESGAESYLHFLAEVQPLVLCVFLSGGQEKVGGLLPSPLITLNDSNGHTFEIKSTYSHAHMHTHTGHTHTDLALHEPDSYTSFVWEPLIAVDLFHPGRKAPRDANIWNFLWVFWSRRYSRRSIVSHMCLQKLRMELQIFTHFETPDSQ